MSNVIDFFKRKKKTFGLTEFQQKIFYATVKAIMLTTGKTYEEINLHEKTPILLDFDVDKLRNTIATVLFHFDVFISVEELSFSDFDDGYDLVTYLAERIEENKG